MAREVDVVFAIDENYAVPAVTVGKSIRANLRDPGTGVRFHVLDSGLGTCGRRCVADGLGAVGDVDFYTVAEPMLLPHKVKHWTSAALARLHVGSVLPAEVTRVVYLDVDTLVLGDLTELLDSDLAGCTVGASINEVGGDRSWILGDTAVFSDHGAKAPGYFNSGVLLIDMEKWRADGVTEQATQLYERYGHELRTHDQDLLNVIFSGAWTPIPEKWNKLVEHSVHGRFGNGRLDHLTRREGIVHFIGGTKPWHPEFPPNALRALYEEYTSVQVPPR
jgi:lipopolysaccharide biosynthesis glycosyltransferase